MKIIISGGGTGGHIYPAIAIAQTLKSIAPETEILFVGAEGKMEMEKVPKAGFEIIGLPIRGLQRSLNLENLKFPFRLAASLIKASKIIRDFKPHVCIGVGGYASGAVMQMAVLQGVATLIQEQNSHAGLTNKWLGKFVNKICVSYPNMENYFPAHKLVYCGNPVRKDLLDIATIKEEACKFFGISPNKKTVLVVGGSLGAKSINEAVLHSIESLLALDFQVVWQTGSTDFGRINEAMQSKKFANQATNLLVKDFIYEMKYAYSVADVVVSRAGALALSELALAAKPVILVPFPHAAEDHQTKNALSFVNQSAGILLTDREVKQNLQATLTDLLQNAALQKKLTTNIQVFARPKAAELIAEEVMKLAKSII
jgi:UDP-N-acetylglucosamine--N-acetylmuramyl-(pentapeptide) pyrophosphoryl-undecaprenol N-acetylglucosamine transferase